MLFTNIPKRLIEMEGRYMALFDNGFRVSTGLVIGIGAVILAPVIMPVLAAAAKPLIKAGLKGGVLLYEKGQEMIAEAQELFEDLAAEVKAELYEASGIVDASVTSPSTPAAGMEAGGSAS
jgi:hypothetical protein